MVNKLIVVIDDEIETIDFLKIALSLRGYEVVGALNAQLGLQLIRERQPDVVIVDLMLPLVSGYEVCRQLRIDPRTARLPIIVLSASDIVAAEKGALAAGADRFILKPPPSIKLLAEMIEAVMTKKQ